MFKVKKEGVMTEGHQLFATYKCLKNYIVKSVPGCAKIVPENEKNFSCIKRKKRAL